MCNGAKLDQIVKGEHLISLVSREKPETTGQTQF